jgi:hypothetical protein
MFIDKAAHRSDFVRQAARLCECFLKFTMLGGNK